MTTSNDILEELKPHQLTRVHGRQPTHQDIQVWTEEAAAIATKIKTRNIKGGTTLHFGTLLHQDHPTNDQTQLGAHQQHNQDGLEASPIKLEALVPTKYTMA
jgi:hypothetical protein